MDDHPEQISRAIAEIAVQRHELALDAAKMGTWEWEPLTGRTTWDACTYELTGIPRSEEHLTQRFFNCIHPDDRPGFDQKLAAQLTLGSKDAMKYEFRFIRPDDNRVLWLCTRAKTFRENDTCRMVGMIFDVTEIKEAQMVAERACKAQTDFLAMLSHELRAPLSPIGTAVELLTRSQDPKVLEVGLGIIQRQTAHLRALVDDLLDVTRLTAGRVRLAHERVNLNDAVTMAMEICQELIMKRGHEVLFEMPHEAIYVDGDTRRIVQVFTNLIQNAAKYTPDGGKLHVSVHSDYHEATFCISDNGPGIPEDVRASMFDLFTQSHSQTAQSEGGLGIGLALVRKLVELHEGKLNVRDNVPHGTVVTVCIPRRARKSDALVP